jgi:germination protein M
VKFAALVVVALALLAGCGGDEDASTNDTTTTTAPTETATVRVYWLRDGKVWPAMRTVDATDDLLNAALDELRAGPTERERSELDFTTAVPESEESELSRTGLAQLVYTMTQFSDTDSAEIDGVDYTRSDFEEQTPPVFVESPLSFEEVSSPITATGTANTFEANFHYTLTDTDGLIVDENFVTATSGSGTRGTFEFTTDAYTVPFDGIGSLIVFERSAEDGSKVNIVEIPLRMSR